MLIIRKFIGFVFVLTCFVFSQNSDGIKSLSHTIKIYYANVFNIQSNDIKLKFIHVPEIDLDREYSVIPTRKKKLGHQTIWIEEKDTGETFPATLEVSAYFPVLVANNTISRKERLTPEMFTQNNYLLSRDFNRYILDIKELKGSMASQVIKKGKALTTSMMKIHPDIHQGDLVGVELVSGNLIVETKGVTRKDGNLGHRAEGILDRTGKKVFGEIVNINLVRVVLN